MGRPSRSLVSSYLKPTTHSPGGVLAARSRSACWISAIERLSTLTLTSSSIPPHAGCECASTKPGVIVIPAASMVSVPGPTRLRTSSLLPTAMKRPFLTANASARGSASSTV